VSVVDTLVAVTLRPPGRGARVFRPQSATLEPQSATLEWKAS
jgi:hypothetical protein